MCFWRHSGAVEILGFDTFGSLKSCVGGCHVGYAWRLGATSRTSVRGSYELQHGIYCRNQATDRQWGITVNGFNLLTSKERAETRGRKPNFNRNDSYCWHAGRSRLDVAVWSCKMLRLSDLISASKILQSEIIIIIIIIIIWMMVMIIIW